MKCAQCLQTFGGAGFDKQLLHGEWTACFSGKQLRKGNSRRCKRCIAGLPDKYSDDELRAAGVRVPHESDYEDDYDDYDQDLIEAEVEALQAARAQSACQQPATAYDDEDEPGNHYYGNEDDDFCYGDGDDHD